jgi:hypothetical protein
MTDLMNTDNMTIEEMKTELILQIQRMNDSYRNAQISFEQKYARLVAECKQQEADRLKESWFAKRTEVIERMERAFLYMSQVFEDN